MSTRELSTAQGPARRTGGRPPAAVDSPARLAPLAGGADRDGAGNAGCADA
ncbi:hypothetical protein [Micromonospora sp. RTGN7]|uniref:hypothetical protein n=1 Tax=Micromonospora sp. RTGN7 TaxID=3016526 RepID=UPI0029FF373D|nr:hypothetical protein [Micromonospora sp. RTGN7]